jgi:hypothetical protein
MLPKEEKIKKKTIDADQPGLFDKESEKDRLKKKRRTVYIAMFLTVGLSLIFLIYHSFKNLNFSFKLPTSNLTVSESKPNNFEIPKNTDASWSVFLKNTESNLVILQENQDSIFSGQSLDSILAKLDKTDFISSSQYSSSLPEGLKIKEIIEEDNNNFSYFSTIITPNQKLLLILEAKNSKDISNIKKIIPNLINQLYWYSLQK